MMNDYTGKVNQTAGASNMAYNNNQGNPSTVYNTAPALKTGYGSLSGGRPGMAPNPATGVPVQPPAAGVSPYRPPTAPPPYGTPGNMPVAPRPAFGRGNDRIVLDPRERGGFGENPGYGEPTYPGVGGEPTYPGIGGAFNGDYGATPRLPRADGDKVFLGGLQGRMGNDYWANMRTQRQDRMRRFREGFATRRDNRFMPNFGRNPQYD